jgi:hypothetical protein
VIREAIVTNPSGKSLRLVLSEPEKSGLIVRKIDGLVPVKSNINVRSNPGNDGGTFNSATTPSRNIVFELEFLPSATITETRHRTYDYFPLKGRVRLDFLIDRRKDGVVITENYFTYGYVESNDPNIFSDVEGTVISVICTDPDFRITDGVTTSEVVKSGDISSIAKLFKFTPKADHIHVSDAADNLVKFGEKFFQSLLFPIFSEGSISVGPTLILTAQGGSVSDPGITFRNPSDPNALQRLQLTFSQSLPALADGDRLEIGCEVQKKFAWKYPSDGSARVNYIGAVSLDSAWPVLRPGENTFSYDAASGGAYIRFSYAYPLKFAGI